jgi:hypothetical protein
VLRIYLAHYNNERAHRGLALLPPESADIAGQPTAGEIERRDRLGGLIHELPPNRCMNRQFLNPSPSSGNRTHSNALESLARRPSPDPVIRVTSGNPID